MSRKQVILFVLAAIFQAVLCGWLSSHSDVAMFAEEVPEPAVLWMLGLGALWLRKQNKKNNS